MRTFGPLVGELCTMAGLPPDPAQQALLDVIFDSDDDGKPMSFEVTVSARDTRAIHRVFLQSMLGWLYLTQERTVLWVAANHFLAHDALTDLADVVDRTADLRKEVGRVIRRAGDEAVEMRSGSRAVFRIRRTSSTRGMAVSKLILDEADTLESVHRAQLLPTIASQKGAQILYGYRDEGMLADRGVEQLGSSLGS